LQFILVGTGIIKDPAAVKAMSRSGDPGEILRGPLFYGMIFIVLTIVYWLDSPIGIVGLMLMCGGDGLAEIIGRRFGRRQLPWSKSKTWLGSFGMLVGGWTFAAGIVTFFYTLGIFPESLGSYLLSISFVALIGTFVESLPFKDIDNITVTVAAIIIGHLVF
jgi:phytol kinase